MNQAQYTTLPKRTMITDQRQYLERELALEASQRNQTPSEHAAWLGAGFTFRVACHYNKIFCVWQHTGGEPKILGKFRICNADMDTYEGLGLCIETDIRGSKEDLMWVTHKPARLFGLQVFAHIPFICEVLYTPPQSDARKTGVTIPCVFKTRSNPKNPVVGDTYVTQIGVFRTLFPEFANIKL